MYNLFTSVHIIVFASHTLVAQGDYNGPRKLQQNGGRISSLKNIPLLQSEEILTDHFCNMYQ